MRRRLPAVFLAALLTFAVSGCGDDSDDAGEPADGESTSQSDGAATDDSTDDSTDDTAEESEPTDSDDADDSGDARGDDTSDKDDDGESDGGDDNGAIPDDLDSDDGDDGDDPNELSISAKVVLDTCEDVDPKDTWPAPGSVSFDDEGRSVVATADVKMKGGQTVTIVCAIAGSENNPQVKAYNPI